MKSINQREEMLSLGLHFQEGKTSLSQGPFQSSDTGMFHTALRSHLSKTGK